MRAALRLRAAASPAGVRLGVVKYCDYIGDIWASISNCVRDQVAIDFVMFESYEALGDALVAQQVDVAWNGNLAHVRLERRVPGLTSLAMRDTDRDFKSVLVSGSALNDDWKKSLPGKRVAAGTLDSAQAYVLPFYFLEKKFGVDLSTLNVIRFDRDLGKHGDTAIGEELALEAVVRGDVHACVMSEMMYKRGVDALKATGTRVLHVFPGFDHCIFDALPGFDKERASHFTNALLAMDMKLPAHKSAMQLEGIRERWVPARQELYEDLRQADGGKWKPKFNKLTIA